MADIGRETKKGILTISNFKFQKHFHLFMFQTLDQEEVIF